MKDLWEKWERTTWMYGYAICYVLFHVGNSQVKTST